MRETQQTASQRQSKSGFTSRLNHIPRFPPRASQGVFMVCFQIIAQFAFHRQKPVLVSTHIKKQNTKAFLVWSRLPLGHGRKYRRFFKTKEEAAQYVSYSYAVYKGRIIPNSPLPGGQLLLF
jgi:hypothetical protein